MVRLARCSKRVRDLLRGTPLSLKSQIHDAATIAKIVDANYWKVTALRTQAKLQQLPLESLEILRLICNAKRWSPGDGFQTLEKATKLRQLTITSVSTAALDSGSVFSVPIRNGNHTPITLDSSLHMPNLRKLRLVQCRIDALELAAPELKYLVIQSAPSLRILPIAGFPSLRRLRLVACQSPMLSISNCAELEEVSVEACPSLQRLEGIEQLSQLKNLRIRNCPNSPSLQDLTLSNPRSLTRLQCDANWAWTARCPNLTRLSIHTLVAPLPSSLTKLSIRGAKIDSLQALLDCPNLTNLAVYACNALRNVADLAHCPKITKLRLSDLRFLNEVPVLPNLTLLSLTRVSGFSLGEYPKLVTLHIESVVVSALLQTWRTLQTLSLSRIAQLVALNDIIDSCPELIYLSVSNCISLQDISALASCHNLRCIRLVSNRQLLVDQYQILTQCHALRTVELGAPEAREMPRAHLPVGCQLKIVSSAFDLGPFEKLRTKRNKMS